MFARPFWRAFRTRAAAQYRTPLSHVNPSTSNAAPWRRWNKARQYTTREAARQLFHKHPYSVSLAAFCILSSAGLLVYANYYYQTYIIGVFQPFPEPVAKPLRRALYYTNISLSPKDALKYYKQALATADELGMDPFSDEILGVKIQVAALMEKIQRYEKAIEVLEIVRGDCLKWIEALGGNPGNEGKRTRVLGKAVGISVKLGDLYSNYYVQDKETAEERLVWAVETVLKEKKRREEEGVKEAEGDWMTDEEFGGALEALAHHYEEKNLHYLSAPLFLQSLAFTPTNNCHAVTLMTNLSSSLAQQQPQNTQPPALDPLSTAKSWALTALQTASKIPPEAHNDECHQGCAVATYNLGEIAEMAGDSEEARQKYVEAGKLAGKAGFREGVERAREAVQRLGNAADSKGVN